ncbi:hypothetical protein UK23_10730 [Lentzea aerocolonigenes]|uniref:Uncharacterized protein n=1 Tax=Lentzea aerocolonigenes TaxID=68170 RepID=A0A0F0H6I5_LENAE|nr:hypothetical protein UK23_10730 [Lentzea aerocolonigenes]
MDIQQSPDGRYLAACEGDFSTGALRICDQLTGIVFTEMRADSEPPPAGPACEVVAHLDGWNDHVVPAATTPIFGGPACSRSAPRGHRNTINRRSPNP